mgnify:CR=1 FL=1
MDISKELLKGYIDIILINLINKKNMYGYEIAKYISEVSNGTFEIKEGTIYLALKRLDKNNLVTSYWQDNKDNGMKRKYYSMTEQGRNFMNQKNNEWIFIKDIIDKFVGGNLYE